MEKWFLNTDQHITGPFSKEQIIEKKRSVSSQEQKQLFVWCKGFSDWIRFDEWSEALVQSANSETYSTQMKAPSKPQVTPQFNNESTVTTSNAALIKNIKNPHQVDKFKVKLNFIDQPDMTMQELLQFTAKQEDPGQVTVFDKKDQLWKEVFTIPEITNELGLSRRKSPRVPIMAQFIGKKSDQSKLTARVVTISDGGLGLSDCFDLKLGEVIQGHITSPHFYSPVVVTTEVTYAGTDGYVGLKFIQTNDEALALIADYVKRFQKNPNEI